MARTKVAIVKSSEKPSEKEIEISVRKAIGLAGGLPDTISSGDTVIIKPNIGAVASPESAIVTDPRVCKAITNVVREIGAKPIVAESSAVDIDTEKAIQVAGYSAYFNELCKETQDDIISRTEHTGL